MMEYDCDGQEEYLVSTDKLNIYFSPYQGGPIFELDYHPREELADRSSYP